MKKILLVIFCLGLGTVSAWAEETAPASTPAKKGFGVSISPSLIRLTGKPGQAQNATVRVSNNGVSSTQVITDMSDVGNAVDKEGRLTRQFPPAGTTPFSCAKWTLLRDSEFTLAPKAFKDVTFIISPPADSVGGSACVVFFRGIPPPEDSASGSQEYAKATIQIQPRLGAMVFYEIEGTVQRTAKLLNISSEPPTANTPLKIHYAFKNTGNTDVLITGTFYILDSSKTLVTKGDLKTIRMFPGDEGSSETESAATTLSSGKYQLVVSFELGPNAREVIVKELEFSIP